ncbi:hypothetical protein DsansV1_C26g0193671 [Dioscorea sansibarensis]
MFAVGPRKRSRAERAAEMRPRWRRLEGESGMRRAARKRMEEGTAARPSERRQPQLRICEVAKFVRFAARTPMPMKNWNTVVRAPRHLAGATSARYTGVACSSDDLSTVFNIIHI